jgi:PRTRC genetic system protein A
MSQSLLDDEAMPWPESAPAPYGHLIAYDGPPEPRGLVADVVVDGAGLYLAASTSSLDVRVRLAKTVVPGLPIVPMGVSLRHGLIDASLWHAIVERARAAIPHEVLLAIVARDPAAASEVFVASAGPYTLVEPQFDETGTGDWQPQRASAGAVRATPIPDAVMEVHSHHTMHAYFSATDDRDETARRVYGVLGRLDTEAPEIALRVPTGCKPHAVGPIPFGQVFAADLGAFRDVHFSSNGTNLDSATSSRQGLPSTVGARPFSRPSVLLDLLLGMAEDVAVIRDELDGHRRLERHSPLWTPR